MVCSHFPCCALAALALGGACATEREWPAESQLEPKRESAAQVAELPAAEQPEAPEALAPLRARAAEHLATARAALAARDRPAARAPLREGVAALLADPAAREDRACTDLLFDLGVAAYHADDFPTCREAWTAVHDWRTRNLPPDDTHVLAVRINFAGILEQCGEPRAAADLLEQLVASLEAKGLPDDHPYLERARVNLALSLKALGELRRARDLQERCMVALERAQAPEPSSLLIARLNYGGTLRELGELAESRAVLERAVAEADPLLPEEDADLLAARGNLASTLDALGEGQRARAIDERCLEIEQRILPPGHPNLQGTQVNLAVRLLHLGDLAGGRALLEEVVAVRERTLPEDHPDRLRVLMNLSGVLLQQGERERAEEIDAGILAILERTLPPDDPEVLRAQINYVNDLLAIARFGPARELAERVHAACEASLPVGHPLRRQARIKLAVAHYAAEDYAAAYALDAQTLEELLASPERDGLLLDNARKSLAWDLEMMGEPERARPVILDLARSMRRLGRDILAVAPREAGERAVAARDILSSLYSLVRSRPAGDELHAELFAAIEELRAGASAPRWIAHAGAEAGEVARAQIARVAELRRALAEAVEHAARGGTADPDLVPRLTRERDRLEADLRAAAVERGSTAPEVSVAALSDALPEGGAAVGYRVLDLLDDSVGGSFYERSSEVLLAHVVRADGTLARVDLGPLAPIEAAIAAWRGALGKPVGVRGVAPVPARDAEPGPDSDERAAGDRLRAVLFDPLMPAVGDARALFVCLDGPLHLAALEALPLAEATVGDRYAVRVQVSFAPLLAPCEAPAAEPALLVVGGVDYGDEPDPGSGSRKALSTGFAPLSGARAEALAIAERFRASFARDAVLLTGPAASRAAFQGGAQGARFLHVATHGWFEPESAGSAPAARAAEASWMRTSPERAVRDYAPLTLCGLAFAGANGGPDAIGRRTGILTAEELAGLDLAACELAVLSACETNVGIARAGQGVASLQAALHSAGARSAITSLWKVDDMAARELFEDFYARLWSGQESKAQALWSAKAALRARGRPTRDWAAWVLTGDTR